MSLRVIFDLPENIVADSAMVKEGIEDMLKKQGCENIQVFGVAYTDAQKAGFGPLIGREELPK